jgi:hypothetical protein
LTRRTAAQRRLIIDDLATILRKPTAAPTISPAELIAVTLSTTQWVPGRFLDPDDVVVQSILQMLKEGGYAIVPATKEDFDATE